MDLVNNGNNQTLPMLPTVDATPQFDTNDLIIDLNDHKPFQFPSHKDEHFENLAFKLSPTFLKSEGEDIWRELKKEDESYQSIQGKARKLVEMAGISLPDFNNTSGSSTGPYKNSGTADMYSSAMKYTCLSIVTNAMTYFLMKDQKIDVQVPNGILTPDVEASIERIKKFLNVYFGGILRNYAEEMETSFWWTAFIGQATRKIHFDPVLGIPTATLIEPGYFFDGNLSGDFYKTPSFTHKFYLYEDQLLDLMDNQEWIDEDANPASDDDTQQDGLRAALLKIHGRDLEVNVTEGDGKQKYTLFERQCYRHIPEDPLSDPNDRPLPYIYTLGQEGVIYSIKRNWDKDDTLRLALEHTITYSLLPTPGYGGMGVAQISGNDAKAATVLERNIIDASLVNISPKLIMKENASMREQTITMSSSKILTLATGDDNIESAFSTIPTTPPNPIILQLKKELEDNIKKVSMFISEDLMQLAQRSPSSSVLTILNRMEMLPNSIMQKIYNAFCKELSIFKRKFYEWLPEGKMLVIPWQGDMLNISKLDFSPHIKIMPAGNFSHESTSYKLVRAEWMAAQAAAQPQLHNMPEVMKNLYKEVGLDEKTIQSIMAASAQPFSGDPATENMHLMTNKPVKALLPQAHSAHIAVHQLSLQHINNPADPVFNSIQAHIREHQALDLMVQLETMSGVQMPDDVSQLPMMQQNQLAMQLAQGAQKLAQQQAQQQPPAPPPPIDPAIVGFKEIEAQKEIARLNEQVKMAKVDVDRAKVALERSNIQAKNHLEMTKLQVEDNKNKMELQKMQFEAKKDILELELKKQEMNLKQHKDQRDTFEVLLKERDMELKKMQEHMKFVTDLQPMMGSDNFLES